MMEIGIRISELFGQGKCVDEIVDVVCAEYTDKDAEFIKKAVQEVQVDIKKQKDESDKKEADLQKLIDKAVDERLKNIKSPGVIETKGVDVKVDPKIEVKESPDLWKKEMADMLLAKDAISKRKASEKDYDKVRDLNRKWAEQREKATGVRTDSDAAGGYFVPETFDAEVDKLIYRDSQLLNAITIRQGGEHTEINGLATFDLSFRSDQNTAFGTTVPTFSRNEIKYREAGVLVPVSNAELRSSFYNVISELTEQAADAQIRLLEPLVIHGKTATDPFLGIWHTSGITSVDAANKAGSGEVKSADLTNAYANIAAQDRVGASAVMDTREALVLLTEKASDGHNLGEVIREGGGLIHVPTGMKIVISDTLTRVLTKTANSGGTMVPVVCGNLRAMRIYREGGLMVDTSNEVYFTSDQLGVRFMVRYKQGVPDNSVTKFVRITDLKNNAPS